MLSGMRKVRFLAAQQRHAIIRLNRKWLSTSATETPPDEDGSPKSMFRKGTESGTKDDLIWALKKKEELGLQVDYVEADAGFEVLALMHKSNNRFTLKHFKDGELVRQVGDVEEVEEGEKHLAPQHRRFLTHPKVGPGAPRQREKMNSSLRLDKAAASAHKYQMVKLGYVDQDAGTNDLTKHKGIDSIIEDKIQLAILQGDFDNLPTAGKPTKVEYQNPLVDRTTDLAYEILRKNGIKPEWIELQQSMNQLKDDLRARLRAEWARHCIDEHTKRVELQGARGPSTTDNTDDAADTLAFRMPANASGEEFASRIMVKYDHDERVCNSKVDAYNLNVPSHVLTRGRVILSLEVDKVRQEVVFSSEDEARTMHTEWTAAARVMEHHRYAASLEMVTRGQDKNAAIGSAPKGPGHRYQRTVYTSNSAHSPTQSAAGASSGFGNMYHSHGYAHGSSSRKSLLANFATRSGSGSGGGGNGDLVMRSLMMPIDLLANSLMKAMDRFSF